MSRQQGNWHALIGIEFCDPTTFEASRLMYWPSCCSDSQYVAEVYDKPFCSLDGVLGMYGDWRDISQWPQVPGADAIERRRLARQENPFSPSGALSGPSAGRTPSPRRWKSSFRGCTRKRRCRGATPTPAAPRSAVPWFTTGTCFCIPTTQRIRAAVSW